MVPPAGPAPHTTHGRPRTGGVADFGADPAPRRSDMQELAARGVTGVLHTFSENDLAYNRETMGRIVAASHYCGLEVEIAPGGVGQMFGGEAESCFTSHRRDVGEALDDGTRTPSGGPNDPRVRAFVHDWIDAATTPALIASPATSPTGRTRSTSASRPSAGPPRRGLRRALRLGVAQYADAEALAFREQRRVIRRRLRGPCGGAGRRGGGVPAAADRRHARHRRLVARGGAAGPAHLRDRSYWKAFGEDADAMVGEYARRVADLARDMAFSRSRRSRASG